MARGDGHERHETASRTDDDRLANDTENLEAIRLVNENEKIGRIQSAKSTDTDENSRRTRRYRNALENFIPIRRKNKRGGEHPVDQAGLFSFALYSWLSKYLYRAYKKGFDPREWPALSPFDGCDVNVERLEILWRDELNQKGVQNASLKKVVWRFIRTRFIVAFLLFALCNICGFLTQTLIMQKLLEHVQLLDSTYEDGLKWAALLIIGELTRWFLLSLISVLIYRSATRLKLACMILLYRHVIRMNHLGDTNCGELVNLFTNDSQKIFDMVTFGPLIIGGIILTVCGIWYILRLLGTMALLGMLVFLVYFPFQYGLSRLAGYLSSKTVKLTDSRMRLTNEILDSIKLIKLYAWEKRFRENLFDVRKKELNYVFASDCCTNTNFAMAQTLPVIATIVTFLVHLSTGEGLMSAQAFPVATFFTSQMTPMLFRVRDGLQAFIDCSIALRRFKRVLTIEDESIIVSKPILKTQAIMISRGKFSYKSRINLKERQASDVNSVERRNTTAGSGREDEEERLNEVAEAKIVDVLFDITFEATRGKLVGICGHVGSGKSSLLLAALGQLRATEGQVMRDGSCAYVSQQAWIMNATLKDNVLFGERFDPERYSRALHVCNLSYDIETMPGGDQTEIGERGVNLSGGQKQRVALARALYADRDIYFLDDPLSAVDAHVGLHIFNHLITGALRGKTVLFVTHQIQYLNRCDDIYMMRHGRIAEHGTHNDLMKLDQEYAAMVHSISSEDAPPATNNITTTESVETEEQTNEILDNDTQVQSHADCRSSNSRLKNEDGVKETKTTLIEAEKSEEGTIKGETYLCYVRAAGGWLAVFLTLVLTSFYCGSFSFSSWWLAAWLRAGGGNNTDPGSNATKLSDNINDNPNFSYYRTIYAATLGLILASSLIRSFVYCKLTNRAARKLHKDLFNKIMSSPMRFFDTTPAGRIQNLFTRDMDEVDNKLPTGVNFIIIYILQILIAILLISMVFPWFIVPVCILSVVLYFIYQIYRVSLRGLKRMESTSRSPVLSHVMATVQGLDTIHAFEKEEDFKSRFSRLVEENNKYYFLVVIVSRWLGVRVDGLVTLMPCTVALLVAILKGLVPPALAGLALSYSVFISNILQYIIRVMSDVETRFISVERIHRYINLPKTEGDNGKPPNPVKLDWPDTAVLRFQNVCMSYGKDTPLVLNGVSFTVEPRQKIGIVGRTGSGKSSLTVALFRLVELSGGKITIDDVDISEVGLERLRSRLSIIPQEPILFSGTIRSNLDPFKTNSDSEIWEALEKTKLKDRVQSIAGQLDATVGFGGDNLSVGERQLLCLARALLRHTKILVLDEATAAVDPETETVVQSTIQQAFVDSTVLTIAHRLQTVVTCDRILVMDDGKVAEFDTPSNLLANEDSQFSKMMKAARKVATQ